LKIFDFDTKKGIYSFEFDALNTESHSHPVVEIILAKKGTFDLESNGVLNQNLRIAIIGSNTVHKVISQNCIAQILMIESNNPLFMVFLKFKEISMSDGLFFKEKFAQKKKLYHEIKNLAMTKDLKTPTDTRISKSLDLIETNDLDYNNLIPTLTSNVFLSESRLTHLFKEQIGISIKKYLVWNRLKQAIELYLEGKSNLTEVSLESGFFDQAHLTNSFKTVLGVTPSKAYNSRTLQS